MKVSVVIPIYNEKENIPFLYEQLSALYDKLDCDVVFVDDGSTDGSTEELRKLARKDTRVTAIIFRKNFGQTPALSAGFDHAKGDVFVTMDGDLQNDPQDIPRLIQQIEAGYDVVSGWRKHRKDAFLTRLLPSRIANWLISRITGLYLHDYGCTLKAYRRDVIEHISLYGQLHRFIPALADWVGARITEIEVEHHSRRFGTSKYGLSRTIKVILDLITLKFFRHYATRPLHIFGIFGLGFLGLGTAAAVYLVIQRQIYGIPMGNRPVLMLALLSILAGIQVIGIGLLAEMLVRTYHESQKKPIYIIRDICT